jgi:hypothetical protein
MNSSDDALARSELPAELDRAVRLAAASRAGAWIRSEIPLMLQGLPHQDFVRFHGPRLAAAG